MVVLKLVCRRPELGQGFVALMACLMGRWKRVGEYLDWDGMAAVGCIRSRGVAIVGVMGIV